MKLKTIVQNDERFSRSREGKKGWAKSIIDLNRNGRQNGYALVGDWVNQKDELEDGIYIDASSTNGKIHTYNLFTVKGDEYKVIKSIKAQQGWVKLLWDDIDQYLIQERASFKDLLAHLKKVEPNDERLLEFATALRKSIKTNTPIYYFEKEAEEND